MGRTGNEFVQVEGLEALPPIPSMKERDRGEPHISAALRTVVHLTVFYFFSRNRKDEHEESNSYKNMSSPRTVLSPDPLM